MTIVEFLNARLDEDEQTARAATRGQWHAIPDSPDAWAIVAYDTAPDDAEIICEGDREGGGVTTEQDALHIARHDPVRILREVEANRAILDQYQTVMADQFPGRDRGAMVRVVDHMLSVYFDHPDYDPGWAP